MTNRLMILFSLSLPKEDIRQVRRIKTGDTGFYFDRDGLKKKWPRGNIRFILNIKPHNSIHYENFNLLFCSVDALY